MSKVKDLAEKAYPYPAWSNKTTRAIDDLRRNAFIEGYHQAEKDLELSWEDIPKLFSISEQLKTSWWFKDNEQTKLIGTQTFWEEVLKRFKEKKEKEV
jgi:hypothetical protein